MFHCRANDNSEVGTWNSEFGIRNSEFGIFMSSMIPCVTEKFRVIVYPFRAKKKTITRNSDSPGIEFGVFRKYQVIAIYGVDVTYTNLVYT